MAKDPGVESIIRKNRKAVSALFLYSIRLERDGERRMTNAIFRVASGSTSGEFMWHCTRPYIKASLFDKPSPPSMNRTITLASPYAHWVDKSYTQNTVAGWAAAALATPYSEDVDQSVVDALLQIASVGILLPHIPIGIWAWLKRRPSLPPACLGRTIGTTPDVVHHIQRLGDIEILKSYFLLIWSEWNLLPEAYFTNADVVIREEFGGIGMWSHREDLAGRLDHIQTQLDPGLGYPKRCSPWDREYVIQRSKNQYEQLKQVLLEMDGSMTRVLSGMSFKSKFFKKPVN